MKHLYYRTILFFRGPRKILHDLFGAAAFALGNAALKGTEMLCVFCGLCTRCHK
jgi:hypothetical protein